MTGEFAVTFFPNWAAQTKREENLTLEALAERIRMTTAPTKEQLPWLKLARFGEVRNPKTGSQSLRWNGNVLVLSGIVVDYDGGTMPIEEATERLREAGISAIVYTSPSHMLNGHGSRWRIVCPFALELSPEAHGGMVARLNGVLKGVLAPESWTLSQSYFYGRVDSNPAYEVIIVEGSRTIDQCADLDQGAIGKPNGNSHKPNGVGCVNGHAHHSGKPEAEIGDICAALEVIPNPMPGWDLGQGTWNEWSRIVMAVWRASGGSEESFSAFDR
jgi:hypothetical protein